MNYKIHYDKLIERGKRTLIHGYRELHHIIPRCMGGTNTKDNLVYLTAEEHFVAHKLLSKMYPNEYKLILAIAAMQRSSKNQVRNNKIFGKLRDKIAEASRSIPISEESRLARIKSNTGQKRTEETKRNISESLKGRKNTPESNAKRAFWSSNRLNTEETKKKMSESAKLCWAKRKGEIV